MIELVADMWSVLGDVHVVTTNGDVNARGQAVMGRGCAKEAAQRFDGLAQQLGQRLTQRQAQRLGSKQIDSHSFGSDTLGSHTSGGDGGNHVHDLGVWSATGSNRRFHIVSFPVKHHWHELADLELIERSAEELFDMAMAMRWKRVVTVRPGCGNGGLEWKDVRPAVKLWFGTRFIVCHK